MSRKLQLGLFFTPVILVWGLFFAQASFFWGSEGYYFFGWLVPPITAYLLWYKMTTLPPVEEKKRWGLGLFSAFLMLVFAILYGMYETMPFWRPLIFSLGAVATGFSFAYVASVGGWRWARHFLSLFLITLICLPWPSSWEADIVFRLTMAVTRATEASLNILGYAATSVGNRIDIQGQSVEVGDACSGIRSFQGLFMVGIVVGELYRFKWRRLVLMVAAFAISFPLNIFRALALSLIVVSGGGEAYDRWHDPLGGIVYAVGCVSILLFGQLIQSKNDEVAPRRGVASPLKLSIGAPITLACCLAAFALFLEFHFNRSYQSTGDTRIWEIRKTDESEGFKRRTLPIEPMVYEILLYDDANHLELYSDYGDRFEYYDFTYEGGMMGVLAAEHHTPEVCIGKYGGGVLRQKKMDKLFSLGGVKIPTFGFTFEYPGGFDLHAFQGVWIAGDNGTPSSRYNELIFATGTERMERISVAMRRLIAGKRDYVVQVFLVVIAGDISLEEAWLRSEAILSDTIHHSSNNLDLSPNS